MAGDPSKMTLWTGYFDSKLTRSSGRRVAKDASIPQPSLDALAWAAKKAGIRKMKKQPEASHPSRPHASEGRLVLDTNDAMEATASDSKEAVMRQIGLKMRSEMMESKQEGRKDASSGPAKGDRRKRAQRKSFKQKGGQRKRKFGRK
ncbi:MAG: hypothetical protein CMB58_003880 [Methanobacteriota archaeon]|jgi:signal recognition particle subunit SEC65|nr:hypothetical protein [Euryarchaeota archaeon]RAH16474.1 MAG: hypothetical protein CMB58_003880 [Euryarchaeota archaeon]|tara:strand:- start:1535 stop:1975 length:441 start_codon:yes stop_codon:yes gene_type:complete